MGFFAFLIVGVLTVAERETSQQTADLCLTLSAALAMEQVSVSLKDIGTPHRMPSRGDSREQTRRFHL